LYWDKPPAPARPEPTYFTTDLAKEKPHTRKEDGVCINPVM